MLVFNAKKLFSRKSLNGNGSIKSEALGKTKKKKNSSSDKPYCWGIVVWPWLGAKLRFEMKILEPRAETILMLQAVLFCRDQESRAELGYVRPQVGL